MGPVRGALLATLFGIGTATAAELSTASVRTFGRVSSSDDSIRIRIDAPAQPADVGAGAFTIEQWLRCRDQDNAPPVDSAARAGDGETGTFDWIYGRIFLDRDIDGVPPAGGGDWGASAHPVAGDAARSVVRFGAERAGSVLTIQGSTDVCDDTWHHVALGRDAANRLFLYVDGDEDYRSTGTIAGDLRYPDGTGSGEDPFLVWGNEKHAYWAGYRGYLDELRVWSIARTAEQVAGARFTPLAGGTSGLELYLRLEEGSGQALADTTGKSSGALLYDGVPGNGEWTTAAPSGGGTTSTSTSSSSSTSATASTTSSSTSSTSSTSSITPPPASTSTSTTSTSKPSASTTSTSVGASTTLPAASSTSTSSTTSSSAAGPTPTTSTSTRPPAPTSTTSTTVPEACAGPGTCDDLDPCTTDACAAGACSHELPAGVASARCELGRLSGAPLCPGNPPSARFERTIARRIADAARLLGAAHAKPERPRGRRRIAAALARLRRAERRITSAAENDRLDAECAAELLGALGRSRGALVPADAVQRAPSPATPSW